ncbi:hypothetical protein Gpo141_00011506 [Globisporangium polare]
MRSSSPLVEWCGFLHEREQECRWDLRDAAVHPYPPAKREAQYKEPPRHRWSYASTSLSAGAGGDAAFVPAVQLESAAVSSQFVVPRDKSLYPSVEELDVNPKDSVVTQKECLKNLEAKKDADIADVNSSDLPGDLKAKLIAQVNANFDLDSLCAVRAMKRLLSDEEAALVRDFEGRMMAFFESEISNLVAEANQAQTEEADIATHNEGLDDCIAQAADKFGWYGVHEEPPSLDSAVDWVLHDCLVKAE